MRSRSIREKFAEAPIVYGLMAEEFHPGFAPDRRQRRRRFITLHVEHGGTASMF